MQFKAYFFDLDDTILSYEGMRLPAKNKVCSDFAKKHSITDIKRLIDEIEKVGSIFWSDPERHRKGRLDIDNTRIELYRKALENLNIFSNRELDKYSKEIALNYANLHEEMIDFFPGAKETLEYIRDLGVKTALITNGSKEKQYYKIRKFKLEKYFDIMMVEGELGYGKPDKRLFEDCLRILRVDPKDTAMVGDNLLLDVKAAQNCSIFGIWNDYAKTGLPDNDVIPDMIINSITMLFPEESL